MKSKTPVCQICTAAFVLPRLPEERTPHVGSLTWGGLVRCKLKGQLHTPGNIPDSFSTNCFNNATSHAEEVEMLGSTGRK